MKTTVAYQCYELYRNGFFTSENISSKLKEYRNFFSGKQYEDTDERRIPKPVHNLCREFVEKNVAKILETPIHVQFISDSPSDSLNELDQFYEYQMKAIEDDVTDYETIKTGFIDGTACVFTIFDEDTLGCESKYRGWLKRSVIPFEQTFYENPYRSDVQDQKYIGYFFRMSIGAIKELLEEKTQDNLEAIVPEDFYEREKDYQERNINSLETNVYVRLFREKGEVKFEMCTKYVNLFKTPHYLNPSKNDTFDKVTQNEDVQTEEYAHIQEAKYNLFTKAKKGNNRELKSKFNRYPVSLFKPIPIKNKIYGDSPLRGLIPNQKANNFLLQQIMLIVQAQSSGKLLAKPEAMKNQVYDGDPSQIIYDYTPMSRGVAWGITRLNGDGGIPSQLFSLFNAFVDITRQNHGFENLNAVANTDTSGYAYQQMISQSNLMLLQPQKRFWEHKRHNASIDLEYFKFYVDEACYYVVKSDSEVDYQEANREMVQDVTHKEFPVTPKIHSMTLTTKEFDKDFQVIVNVESGIASSEISESQHYQQIFQYIASGNLNADMVRVMVENDPAFSQKTRQSVIHSLKTLEISQLARKDEEINMLKQTINSLTQNLKVADNNMKLAKERYVALEKASAEQSAMNKAFLDMANKKTESEVKSNNAKGIAGTSFS